MSWSDILYPGNEERRVAVVRKLQDLLDSMAGNFRATNKLVQYLNDNITTSNLPKIYVDYSKTLRDNADVLLNQIKAIDAVLDKIDKELKKKLDPELYATLTNVDTSFEQKIEISQKVTDFVAGITGATVGGVVGEVVAKKLTNLVMSKAAKLAASTIAGAVAGAIAGMAVDIIIGSIIGAVERDQLESALQELQAQVEEFIPASEEYTDNIFEVMATVKIWEKYNPKN